MTEAEFLPLFDQYHNMVYRLALTSLRSAHDAEDMVQTVFLKLLSIILIPNEMMSTNTMYIIAITRYGTINS